MLDRQRLVWRGLLSSRPERHVENAFSNESMYRYESTRKGSGRAIRNTWMHKNEKRILKSSTFHSEMLYIWQSFSAKLYVNCEQWKNPGVTRQFTRLGSNNNRWFLLDTIINIIRLIDCLLHNASLWPIPWHNFPWK